MEVQVPTPTPSWSSILKEQSQPTNNQSIHRQAATDRVLVGSCHSTKGIAVAVVDANAIIQGGEKLIHSADRFVSVSEVIDEVRDPTSRHFLSFLPFTVDTLEPSSDDLRKVINFARATGDLQTLSDVDLKLIALTYTLEAQIHGTKHLRDSPPPIHTVNVKRLPEKDMPGWGNNVPNLKEWEALEHAVENGSNCNSRILPLKDLSENTILIDQEHGAEVSLLEKEGESNSWTQEYADESCRKPRKYSPTKKEVKIEGKKMVVDGIDASQGQFNDDAGDWRPAVSRSTHRRYLRRKARREMYQTLSETDSQHDTSENIESGNERCPDLLHETSVAPCTEIENPEEIVNENSCEDLSTILNQMRMDEESLEVHQDGKELNYSYAGRECNKSTVAYTELDNIEIIGETNDVENLNEGMDQLAITSQISESVDTSYMDDNSTEQSWTLRSLSDSSVACITGDFAMQNVLLQIGLRLVAPGGMQIRELHRWILKCHACFKITNEIGRIFCPSCGNGGTLRKVAVTVGENGIVLAARRPRISLRGTKFSLPLPKGGRNGITKNPILREDQLPQKFLYPKTKKKNKQGEEEIFTRDEIFLHHTDKKAPLQPPIRKALGVFSGKRNPNDNHFSRSMH